MSPWSAPITTCVLTWVEEDDSTNGQASDNISSSGAIGSYNGLTPIAYLHAVKNRATASPPIQGSQPIQGSSPTLQGSSPTLQGSSPTLRGPSNGGQGGGTSPPSPSANASVQIGWSGADSGCITMTLNGFPTGSYSYTCDFASGGDATYSLTETSAPETFDNGETCHDLQAGTSSG